VLVVDDWAATGAQAAALRSLFPDAYVGTAVIVSECSPAVSISLDIRGLLTGQDLM